MPKISVIICTHNPREDYLRRVLEALRRQSLPMINWELLLIDNASPSPLSDRFDLCWHPQGRHIREDRLGLSFARIRGIEESSSDLLVFVDDDAVLAPDYLEQALKVADEWPFIGVFGGSCVPEFEADVPRWVPKNAWQLTIVEVKEDIWSNLRELTTFPVGAGLCCRRVVANAYLDRLRKFPKGLELGRKGTGLAGFEDMDICQCAVDAGLGTGKSTRLNLIHLIRASRLTTDYFVRHAEGDAQSYVMYRALRGFPLDKPNPMSWYGKLRWFLHRVKNRVPREVYEMQKAAKRGTEKGYAAAQEYLKSVNHPPA
jgi:glycosyltransferase involved in cell wall biosynthesis